MELRSPIDQIDDPFFAAVRRRHPDVDVVLVPAPEPASATETVTDDEVAATLARVAVLAGELWSAAAPGATERPDSRLAFGADESSVRAVARVVARRDDGSEVLGRLRHERDGLGGLDGIDLTASYAEEAGVLLLTLASASMPVGVDRARELTRGGER